MSLQDAVLTADSTHAAKTAKAVTKSDTTNIFHTRALYIGGGGDVVVTMMDGASATFTGVLAGTILPIQCTQVKAATTATDILALY